MCRPSRIPKICRPRSWRSSSTTKTWSALAGSYRYINLFTQQTRKLTHFQYTVPTATTSRTCCRWSPSASSTRWPIRPPFWPSTCSARPPSPGWCTPSCTRWSCCRSPRERSPSLCRWWARCTWPSRRFSTFCRWWTAERRLFQNRSTDCECRDTEMLIPMRMGRYAPRHCYFSMTLSKCVVSSYTFFYL